MNQFLSKILLLLTLLIWSGAAFHAFAQCSSCNTTVSSSSSSTFSINGNGKTLCITGGTFSGTVNINGLNNTLCIGSSATFTGTVNMNGTNVAVNNHGTYNAGSTTSRNGIFNNFGTFTTSNLITNSGGVFNHLGSTMNITGNLENSGEMNFINPVTIGGNLVVNSSIGVEFSNTLSVAGNVVVNDSLSLYGDVSVSGSVVVNGAGVLKVDGGILSINGDFTHYGTSVGSISDCGGITVGGTSINTGNFATDGSNLDICDGGGGFDSQFGSVGGSVSNCTCTPSGPLPIELVQFKAVKMESHVALSWSTASEIDNSFFTVERSFDGVAVEIVDELSGAGYSNQMRSYATKDPIQGNGMVYYRLLQTDFNGTTTTFDWHAIDLTATDLPVSFQLGPNPITDGSFWVACDNCGQKPVNVQIINIQGQEVTTFSNLNLGQANTQILSLENGLPSGYYFLRINAGQSAYVQKLMVN